MSQNELLDAVRQLNPADFQHFVSDVLELRAARQAPSVATQEGELLQKISTGLPEDLQFHYRELREKRRAETLTADEHAELLRLSEKAESLEVERMSALLKLADLRRTPLSKLMDQLGIRTPANGD